MASGSPPAASSIDDCEPLIDALYIRRTTRGLDRLARLPNLRTIRAAGLRDAEFESLCNAAGLTHLAVFGSRISDLTPLRRLTRLRALTMTGNTKARTLDGLDALRELEYLALAEFTGSFSLEPVGRLDELRFLWLSGTTWTPMRVDSLGPLSALRRLERLQLPGVRVADRKLAALRGLEHLVQVELPDYFPAEEFLALHRALRAAKGFWLDAHASGKARPRRRRSDR